MSGSSANSPRQRNRPVEGGGVAGFLFGLVFGFLAVLGSWTVAEQPVAYALIAGVVVGLLGFFFGDRFWFWLTEKLTWFS